MTSATKVFVGRATKARKGDARSAVAFVEVRGKYPKRYEVRTKGMDQPAFEQAIVRLEERHARREAKVDQLQTIVGKKVSAGEVTFTVSAAILRDRGTDVELYVQLFRGGKVAGVISRVYPDAADVPATGGVLQLVRAFVDDIAANEEEHAQFTAGIQSFLRKRAARAARVKRAAKRKG